MSGSVARTNGIIRRPMPATAAVATTMTRTASGPVQPRTANATSASQNAIVSFVAGARLR
jgi:hypothetical protein